MSSRIYETELAGRPLKIEIGKVAALTSGACLVYYGDTVVISTATASEKPREGIDFFPLSVDYEEKFYSVGKLPGGFLKREGRPSENAILTSRVIDRPIRPLFPKDYRNDCGVVNSVLSVDQDCQPEIAAMIGTSIALSISDIPFAGPLGSVFVGLVDGEYVFNPTAEEREKTEMMVTVCSTREKITMIEANGNEIPEDVMVKGIFAGHEFNKELIKFIDTIVEKEGKAKQDYIEVSIPEAMFESMKEVCPPEQMEEAVFTSDKSERFARIEVIKDALKEKYVAEENEEFMGLIDEAIYQYQKKTVRKMILKDHKRPDGRAIDEIRPLSAEVDILPRTHGSGLFSRGETQVLNICTLSVLSDAQIIDGLDKSKTSKRYMHHYNFPSYSVGETRPSRGPGRREIGHGALAERALIPVLPSIEEFPYAIRTVSEVTSSNGSTSQASICGSTLSLMAAGVPIKKPVAGISCGLVTGEKEDDYILLTDIQGLEDFFGDMDFKVAGTKDGITTIQLDMKLKGISNEIVEKAIYQNKEARMFILEEVMEKAIAVPREKVSKWAPKIAKTVIDTEKIGEVVGPRGKTINKIIDETGVKIDIQDDGNVFIYGDTYEAVNEALNIIEMIGKPLEIGQVLNGKVVRITNFGAFVELAPGKDGLLHISKISNERVEKVEDVLSVGQELEVKVVEIDRQGRINLSRKALLD